MSAFPNIEIHSNPELGAGAEVYENLLPEIWKRPEMGFFAGESFANLQSLIEDRLESLGHVERVIVVGIGGSSLGTRVIHDTLGVNGPSRFFFLESIDPVTWQSLLRQGSDWRDAHLVFVSKSGGTLETLTWIERLFTAGWDPSLKDRVTVIAGHAGGLLQSWAKDNAHPVLAIPEKLSGRFSVLSAVGMWPAALMGLSPFEFHKGALWAMEQSQLVCHIAALIENSWRQERWITQMWSYSESLRCFGLWWQQLWSESLAKRKDMEGRDGPKVSTPMTCLGPRDQHSLLQQLIEGPQDKYVFLNRVTQLENDGELFEPKIFARTALGTRPTSIGKVLSAEAQAFERSLVDTGIPYTRIEIEKLSESSLGAMFMLWQIVVVLLGERLRINPFNQPGVELGKRHVRDLLNG